MGALIVRRLDDALIKRLKERAARNNRSAEAEHREILRQALEQPATANFWELAALARAMTAGRKFTPSEVLVREGRDER
jgi:plasmid stability protein